MSRGDGDDHPDDFNAVELGSPRVSTHLRPSVQFTSVTDFFRLHSPNC